MCLPGFFHQNLSERCEVLYLAAGKTLLSVHLGRPLPAIT